MNSGSQNATINVKQLQVIAEGNLKNGEILSILEDIKININDSSVAYVVHDTKFIPVFRRLCFNYLASNIQGEERVKLVVSVLDTILTSRAFSLEKKNIFFKEEAFNLVKACIYRATTLIDTEALEQGFLAKLVHSAYLHGSKKDRLFTRSLSATLLSKAKDDSFTSDNSNAISLCLTLCGYIFKGLSVPVHQSHKRFFQSDILPLHKLCNRATDTKKALSLIHKGLVFSIVCFLEKAPEEYLNVVEILFKMWPDSWAGNTPKEVLLMNELESLLELPSALYYLKNDDSANKNKFRQKVLEKVQKALSSQHSMVCQKALLYWQNHKVYLLFQNVEIWILPLIIPILLTKTIKHWNTTVRRMCALILKKYYQDKDHSEYFKSIVAETIGVDVSSEGLTDYLNEVFETNGLNNKGKEMTPEELRNANIIKIPEKLVDLSVMNIVLGDVIGEGSFGKVYVAYKVEKGKPRSQWVKYGLKEISKEHETVAYRELKAMDFVSHPNCLSLIGYYLTSKTINLVMEFAEKGDLHNILIENIRLEITNTKFIVGEVLAGLNAFHANNLVFGDLKPENVLVFSNNHVKLCDFGAVRKIEELRVGAPIEGTFIYLAPEIVAGQTGGIPSDFWSLGCLMYQMMYGRPPFKADGEKLLPRTEAHKHFLSGAEMDVRFETLRPSAIDKEIELAQDTMKLCFQIDPLNRATYESLLKVEFFESLDVESFDLLCSREAPEIKSSVKARGELGGNQPTAWTQRTYSMMVSPVPQRHAFEEGSEWVMKMIPENPGEQVNAWTKSGSLGNRLDVLKVDPESIKYTTGAGEKDIKTKTHLNMRQRAFANNASGRKMPQLNVSKMLAGQYGNIQPLGRPQNPSLKTSKKKENEKSTFIVNGVDLSAG